jgi:predicted outer membrane repeat protein
MKTQLLLSLFSILLCGMLPAQTFRYVDPNGTNTGNDCTQPGNPCATIPHALNEANANDIIDLAPGAYTISGTSLLIQKSITIQGTDRETTFIQAHQQPNMASNRVISISDVAIDVIIKDVTIRHGVASGAGVAGRAGGLYYIYDENNPSTLEIENVRFAFNTARVGGGMFVTSNATPVIKNTVFNDNSATERGGAMYLYLNSEPIIDNVVFNVNSAGITGGAIYANASNPSMTYCNFTSNYASLGCGAIAFQSGSGGGLTGGGFYYHQVSGNGGAVCIDGGSSPNFSFVQFENNEALGGSGGAVHIVNNSSPSFSGVDFTDNQATNENGGGGAIYVNANSHPEFKNTNFISNSSFGDGGGILAMESDLLLENVRFEQNTTDNNGGGLFLSGANSSCVIKNGFFIENSAEYGGGTCIDTGATEYVNVVFSDNNAVNEGGAIYNNLAITPYYYNLTFSGNTADYGGAIYNAFSSTHFIYNSIFWQNTANQGSEIYNNPSSAATIHYSLIENNPTNVVEGNGFDCFNCIDGDPLFANPATHNYLITEGSPAIDAGDPNTTTMPYPQNGNNDPIDIVNNPRFVEIIDMGAYEWNENLSVEAIKNPLSVTVFPNPATEVLHLVSKENIDNIKLYDLTGKEISISNISKIASGEMNLNLMGIESGIYLLRVHSGSKSATFKIIKQ